MKAAQIREIAGLIGKGKWVIGQTEHKMALRWGLGISAIRERAAEARRLVEFAFGSTEDLRADVLAQLAGIAGEMRRKEPRTAVTALMGIAAITGLVVTHRADYRDAAISKKLPPQERIAEATRIRAQLDQVVIEAEAELASTVDMVEP